MIKPFIHINSLSYILKRTVNNISLCVDYLHSLNTEVIPFNLLIGKCKSIPGEPPCEGMMLLDPTYKKILQLMECIYFECNTYPDCEYMIIIDLDYMYTYGDLNLFDFRIRECFFHEYKHIYQQRYNIYDFRKPNMNGDTSNEHNNLPWEKDANQFAADHLPNAPLRPYLSIEKRGIK